MLLARCIHPWKQWNSTNFWRTARSFALEMVTRPESSPEALHWLDAFSVSIGIPFQDVMFSAKIGPLLRTGGSEEKNATNETYTFKATQEQETWVKRNHIFFYPLSCILGVHNPACSIQRHQGRWIHSSFDLVTLPEPIGNTCMNRWRLSHMWSCWFCHLDKGSLWPMDCYYSWLKMVHQCKL